MGKDSTSKTTERKTERSAVAVLMHWMRNIIEENAIDLGPPDVDTIGVDGKYPDTVIYENPRSKNVLFVMEAKPPYYDVFNEEELKEPARTKAVKRRAKYFATTNFKTLVWYNLEKVNSGKPEEEQIIQKYDLSDISDLDMLESAAYKNSTVKGLKQFLLQLYLVSSGKIEEPRQAIDEFLIFRLHEKIRILTEYYTVIIRESCDKNPSFATNLIKWFLEQGWSFYRQYQDFNKAARQTAYLLVNKILFYNVLQAKRRSELEPLEIPQSLFKGESLQAELQKYFKQVLKIDYETIYSTDFIDSIAFPDSKEVVQEIKELIDILKRYDFATLGYDIIGRIFERLIPQRERHTLGQYFTSPDVVDLILKFCMEHEDDKVFDPACGAGTFLVRAYYHKKMMNQFKEHKDILESVWGNDIAKFPATLSMINLAIRDLSINDNYPNILCEDFFNLHVDAEGFEANEWRKRRAKTLNKAEREITYPRRFDVIVGNPPYTRQEEIGEISPDAEKYKEDLIKAAISNLAGNPLADISKRAGIHAYFFVHGTKFLKDKGKFGFIVSNSWMDVEYGKGLQEYLLQNYKIITIIESKVERWFEEADVNTCIIILEKCKEQKEREENPVRFVYLKKPLREFIPPSQEIWANEIERLKSIDNFKRTILAHNNLYENELFRIYPKKQGELWQEGFDYDEQSYTGSKWGKYLRAPEIYFKILEKAKDKFVFLKILSKVRFGIKTGANEFFYLKEENLKKKKIEDEFSSHKDAKGQKVLNKVFVKANELREPLVNPQNLKNVILFIKKDKKHLERTNVLDWIKNGERHGFHKRPTCSTREPTRNWYNLGDDISDIIAFPERVRKRYIVFYNPERVSLNKNLYGIEPKDSKLSKVLAIIMNSTLIPLYMELFARQPGGGGGPLDIDVYVTKDIWVPKEEYLKKYKKELLKINILERKTENIFKEIGTENPDEISLDGIVEDRRKLDKIIMGDILGLSEDEQKEVYKAVVDLVKSRIEKAQSFKSGNKIKEGMDIDAFVNLVLEKIGSNALGKFYKVKISPEKVNQIEMPEEFGKPKIERMLRGYAVNIGKNSVECDTEIQARYLAVFAGTGLKNIYMPKKEEEILKALDVLEESREEIDSVIDSYLESVVSQKAKQILLHHIWTRLFASN